MPDNLDTLIRAVEDADSSLRLQEAVKNLAKHLAKVLRSIGDQFDIATAEKED